MTSRDLSWLDVISCLVDEPSAVFPRRVLATHLVDTFEVVNVSWNWLDSDGSHGFDLTDTSPEKAVSEDFLVEWQSMAVFTRHPLLRWYAAAPAPVPQTMGRVPRSVASPADHAMVAEQCRPIGCDVQLSIPYVLTPGTHRAFVLARTGQDFSDADLELATCLQRAFAGIERQCRELQRADSSAGAGVVALAGATGLTGREVAVLALLVEGCTAEAIGRRLAISPRTVHKHLEHIYRKLGVSDRLSAAWAVAECGWNRSHSTNGWMAPDNVSSSQPNAWPA